MKLSELLKRASSLMTPLFMTADYDDELIAVPKSMSCAGMTYSGHGFCIDSVNGLQYAS